MLETPLFGRFLGENKYLIFAPAQEYLWLVAICAFGGAAVGVWGVVSQSFYWTCVGVAVCMAGIWGAASLHWISFNLRERVYTRRQGPGMFPKTTRGSFKDLEVIFMIAGQHLLVGKITYRLLLQWRAHKEPPMVLTQTYFMLAAGMPINAGAGSLFHFGTKVSQALGIPLVDNAHFLSANPVPFMR
ncbi:MAG TPA: hypothetical protein VMI31_04800 [Fimbriimonadaceae bacterium]|nr:hypothetical protein [Fimbriimonadaceae bacterium]